MAARTDDPGHPCSRIPPEFCDGARIAWQDDGTSRREPMLTPRAFCDPCRSRILTCLEELPSAYLRLAAALGDAPRSGSVVRAPFGPSVPIRAEIDALMRTAAAVLAGWEARVQAVARLDRGKAGRDPLDPESVKDAAGTLATHIDVLLALQPGWTTRVRTFGFEKSGRTFGTPPARAPVPPDLEAEIGGEEIVHIGDGWVKTMTRRDGAAAGNEVLDLHYRARRALGETRAQPESLDGVPCRACDEMALERAEPPGDPDIPAMHSKCALCKDEMGADDFRQWAEMYARWAHGAAIQVCRRCSAGGCGECCWAQCACSEGQHPRRPVAA